MKIKYLIFLSTLLFFPISLFAQHRVAGNYEKTIRVDGLNRHYTLHLPFGYSFLRKKKLPLLIVLHGGGGNINQAIRATKFNSISNKEKFIVVYPQGYNRFWSDARGSTKASKAGIDDVKFIREMIHKLQSQYKIDERRIYVLGASNGGFMAQTLAVKLPNIFAAIASIIATLPKNLDGQLSRASPLSILYILGTKDPLVPFAGGNVNSPSGGEILSAEESVYQWTSTLHCKLNPQIEELPDTARDQTTVTLFQYQDCTSDHEVYFYRVNNGGHQYPGSKKIPFVGPKSDDINASEVAWTFFKRHSR